MSIGYASKTLAVPSARMQSVVQRLATPDRLAQAIDGNLCALDAALDYQAKNGIHLFRISSDVVPFGSSPVNALDWMRDFEPHLAALGRKARRHGIRLSMHPGQYTVLNSPDADVVERAKLDLAYHAAFLNALGMDASGKIVLHVGGAYGDKPRALERFASAYATLPLAVRRRLVIENDDRLFTARDVLALSRATGAPMVFDTLHH
ncbi:UV DNA damage repair endonuclease UvsE, partial [Eggerthella lenta]